MTETLETNDRFYCSAFPISLDPQVSHNDIKIWQIHKIGKSDWRRIQQGECTNAIGTIEIGVYMEEIEWNMKTVRNIRIEG